MPGQITAALMLLAVFIAAALHPADAAVFNLRNRATPLLSIQVGSGGGTINTVSFTVPIDNMGDGTPIAGSRKINIHLVIRAPGSSPLTGYLTVDSSSPLSNGAGNTIPASAISWTARDGEIPSGTYDGSRSQLIVSFTGSLPVSDQHIFSYANDTIYAAGTYDGRVTYTWSAP